MANLTIFLTTRQEHYRPINVLFWDITCIALHFKKPCCVGKLQLSLQISGRQSFTLMFSKYVYEINYGQCWKPLLNYWQFRSYEYEMLTKREKLVIHFVLPMILREPPCWILICQGGKIRCDFLSVFITYFYFRCLKCSHELGNRVMGKFVKWL